MLLRPDEGCPTSGSLSLRIERDRFGHRPEPVDLAEGKHTTILRGNRESADHEMLDPRETKLTQKNAFTRALLVEHLLVAALQAAVVPDKALYVGLAMEVDQVVLALDVIVRIATLVGGTAAFAG